MALKAFAVFSIAVAGSIATEYAVSHYDEVVSYYSDDTRRGNTVDAFLIAGVIAVCVMGYLIRNRYLRLRDALPALTAELPTPADRLGPSTLGRGLRNALVEARYALADSAAGRATADIPDSVLKHAASAVRRAIRSGEAASVMVRRPGPAVYAVALPVRHPHPQIVHRYLGAAWPDHLAAVQRAVAAPVFALVVLCAPDATEASLLVGFAAGPDDPAAVSDPEALLDVAAACARGANPFRYVMTLSTSPSHEA